jgi:hypothetical protein
MQKNRALLLLHHCEHVEVTWSLPTLASFKRLQCRLATSEERRGATRHDTAELGLAWRKHRFIYCCVIAGTCFKVTVLAWRKYATIHCDDIFVWISLIFVVVILSSIQTAHWFNAVHSQVIVKVFVMGSHKPFCLEEKWKFLWIY